MSCNDFDLRDYFLGELLEPERREAARHLAGCIGCASALEELQLARTKLLTLRDEDPPQRIGFVSDRVFQPSALARWWSAFWLSGARLGFASAGLLSLALITFSFHRTAPVSPQAVAVSASQSDVQALVNEAVRKAVADTTAAQERRVASLLAASERKHEVRERDLNLKMEASFEMLQKRYMLSRAVAMNRDTGFEGGQQ